jgi:oligoribonuclease (3'-5' exoribonuclease)
MNPLSETIRCISHESYTTYIVIGKWNNNDKMNLLTCTIVDDACFVQQYFPALVNHLHIETYLNDIVIVTEK